MGVYYAIFDDKNRRKFTVWKAYALANVFDDIAPFDVIELRRALDKADDEFYTDGFLAAIVDFCTEADWNVRLLSDSATDEWYETDYDDYEFDTRNAAIVPSEYLNDDGLDARIRSRLLTRELARRRAP